MKDLVSNLQVEGVKKLTYSFDRDACDHQYSKFYLRQFTTRG